MGDRLTVGQWPLKPLIGVRVPVPQQMNFDIKQFKDKHFILALLAIILIIAPGFLEIFHFFRDIFINVDFFKLSLLSISFTLPFIFISTLIFHDADKDKNDSLFINFLLAVILSGLVNYFSFAYSYLSTFSFKHFIFSLIVSQIMLILIEISFVINEKKNRKK